MQTVPTRQDERRHREPAIPDFLDRYLTTDQINALHQMENFGWHLAFVRRPLFQSSLTVLQHSDNPDKHAVLLEDGELELNPDLVLRA